MSRYLNESGRHGKENLNDLKLPIINQMQPSHTTRQPNSISPRRHFQGTKPQTFSLPQEHNPQQDVFSQLLSRLENERGPLNKNLQWQLHLIANKERRTGFKCSLKKASELAFKYPGTLLYTDKGITYWSDRIRCGNYMKTEHAEEAFIRMVPDVQGINDIWIKNSPCSRCAVKLRQHFNKPPKPTLHIGKLWKAYEGSKNEKGLKEMKREGFKLRAWYAKEIWGSPNTANYLYYL